MIRLKSLSPCAVLLLLSETMIAVNSDKILSSVFSPHESDNEPFLCYLCFGSRDPFSPRHLVSLTTRDILIIIVVVVVFDQVFILAFLLALFHAALRTPQFTPLDLHSCSLTPPCGRSFSQRAEAFSSNFPFLVCLLPFYISNVECRITITSVEFRSLTQRQDSQ